MQRRSGTITRRALRAAAKRWLLPTGLALVAGACGFDHEGTESVSPPDDGHPVPPVYIEPTDSGAGAVECDGGAAVPTSPGPDLVLELGEGGANAHFTTRTFDADSCSVYEGCVRGSGKRSLLELNV